MNQSASLSKLKGGPLACLFFSLVFIFYFSPVICGHRWLAPEDGRIESLPAFYASHGLWTTDLFCGWPLFADPMVQSFNPLALGLPSLPGGWNVFMLLGYVLAGTFMYLLAYEIVGSYLGALIAAELYCLSGLLFLEANHVLIVHSAAYLPLLLLSIEKQSKNSSSKWLAIGSLAIGLGTVGGHIQVLLYSLFFGAILALYKLISAGPRRKELIWQYFLTIFLGISLGAIQILPTLELSSFSIRQNFTYELFSGGAIHPLQLIGVLFPYFLGSHDGTYFGIQYFGRSLQQPLMCYIGMLPYLLLPLSILLFKKMPPLKFWFGTAILTLLLSLGSATPLAMIFYHIPPFGSMRCHYRVFFLAIVAASICLAFVVKALEESKLSRDTLARFVSAEVGLFGLMLFCLSSVSEVLGQEATACGNHALGFLPWTNPAFGSQSVVLLVTIGMLFIWSYSPKNIVTSSLLVSVLLADLCFQGWFCQWRAEVVPDQYLVPPPQARQYSQLLSAGHQRLLPVRGASGEKDELPPCASRNWSVPSASGYSPIMNKRYQDLTTVTEGGFLLPPWQFTGRDRTFDILAIKYLFTAANDTRLLEIKDEHGQPIFKKLTGAGHADVFENSRAMPRCWLVSQALTLPPEQILHAIQKSRLPDGKNFAPDAVALVETDVKELASVEAAAKATGPEKAGAPEKMTGLRQAVRPAKSLATINQLEPERVIVKTENPRGSFLILSDSFYPGWTATVDGTAVPIYRTDYVLRGVFVPAGEHVISFTYRPFSLYIGASLCALAALLLLFILSKRPKAGVV